MNTKFEKVSESGNSMGRLVDSDFPSYLVNDSQHIQPHLIERSTISLELVGEEKKAFVRVYQVVYAPAKEGSGFKDITQGHDGKIEIIGKKNVWMNMGNTYRALLFMRGYIKQGMKHRGKMLTQLKENSEISEKDILFYNGQPLIRSFLLPIEIYEKITSNAIDEGQRKLLGEYTINSDQPQGHDQYAINAKDLSLIKENALPNSLISYVLDKHINEYVCTKNKHGKVIGVSILLDKLGMPDSFLSDPQTPIDECLLVSDRLNILYNFTLTMNIKSELDIGELKKQMESEGINFPVPSDQETLEGLQKIIASKATFTFMPIIIRDNYNEVTKRCSAFSAIFKGLRKEAIHNVLVSEWTEKQNFKTFYPQKFNGISNLSLSEKKEEIAKNRDEKSDGHANSFRKEICLNSTLSNTDLLNSERGIEAENGLKKSKTQTGDFFKNLLKKKDSNIKQDNNSMLKKSENNIVSVGQSKDSLFGAGNSSFQDKRSLPIENNNGDNICENK